MGIQELLSQYGDKYIQALFVTWKLTAVSFVLAFLIGILITIMRVCPVKPLRWVGDFYVQIFRNIPGATLLIMLVYALPYLNVVLSYYVCVLTATSLLPAAFCSEYLMAGMNTVSIGQIEAARALGMSFGKILKNVVIPQALRSSVLPMTNLLVATMLTTALASQVPMNPTDLTGLVSHINTRAVGGVTAFLISAVLYCATAVVIGQIGNLIDRKCEGFADEQWTDIHTGCALRGAGTEDPQRNYGGNCGGAPASGGADLRRHSSVRHQWTAGRQILVLFHPVYHLAVYWEWSCRYADGSVDGRRDHIFRRPPADAWQNQRRQTAGMALHRAH